MRITYDINSETKKYPVVSKEEVYSCPALSEEEEKRKIEQSKKEPYYIAFGGYKVYLSKDEFIIFKEKVNLIDIS